MGVSLRDVFSCRRRKLRGRRPQGNRETGTAGMCPIARAGRGNGALSCFARRRRRIESSAMEKIREIDGLRAIAIGLVVAWHYLGASDGPQSVPWRIFIAGR